MASDFLLKWDNTPDLPPIIHISESVKESEKYIKGRADGSITSIKTKFKKLDRRILGGFETNTICYLSAISGGGKSTISKCIRDSISIYNKKKYKYIVINSEMLALHQIGRSMVSKTKIKLDKLYSVDEPLTDEELQGLKQYYNELKNTDTYFVEKALEPKELINILYNFWKTECEPGGYTMIYEMDNLMLLLGEDETSKINQANYGLVALKKQIASEGGEAFGLVLNQMNRNIKSVERLSNKDMHKPMASDLMAASSSEYCADYIIFSHIPARLGIQCYGSKRFPTRIVYPNGMIKEMAYFELVKNRSGAPNLTFPLHNKLEYFDFDEMSVEEWRSIYGKNVIQDSSTGLPIIKIDK